MLPQLFGPSVITDPGLSARIVDFSLFLAVVTACGAVLFSVYRYVSPGEKDAREFAGTIFIMMVTIALLVSIIKQAPAISFGLFGAMSIVRFRAQIKQPKRMIFVLMASAIGVCVGAGEYVMTVLGTVVLSVLSLVLLKDIAPRETAWAPTADAPQHASPPTAAAMPTVLKGSNFPAAAKARTEPAQQADAMSARVAELTPASATKA